MSWKDETFYRMSLYMFCNITVSTDLQVSIGTSSDLLDPRFRAKHTFGMSLHEWLRCIACQETQQLLLLPIFHWLYPQFGTEAEWGEAEH